MNDKPGLTEGERDFMLKEHENLKMDYAGFAATSFEMLKYAVVTSGTIFVWLATFGGNELKLAKTSGSLGVVWFTPAILSIALGLVAFSLWLRMERKAHYLAEIEGLLFAARRTLGWHRRLSTSCAFWRFGPGIAHMFAWWTITIGDVAIAVVILCKK